MPTTRTKAIPPDTTQSDGTVHDDRDILVWSDSLGRWVAQAGGSLVTSLPYTALTLNQYIGITTPGVCGETLVVGNAVYTGTSGRLWKTLASDAAKMPAIGVVVAVVGGGVAGQACTVLTDGYINTGTFTAATAPTPIYVSRTTPGLITITAPATVNDEVEFFGYVTEVANVLRIFPCLPTFTVGTGYVDLASEVGSTILPAPNGGTGQSSFAVGDLLYAPTTTTIGKLAAVASGQVLTSAGVSTSPVYSNAPALKDLGLTRGLLTLTGEATPGVPTVALVAGGSMTAGTHYAKVCYVTADGRLSALSSVSSVITTGGSDNSMSVTRNGADAPSADVVSWNIYATKAGATSTYYLIANVAVGTSAYTITIADASFGTAATATNDSDQTAGIIFGTSRAWYMYGSDLKSDLVIRPSSMFAPTGSTYKVELASAGNTESIIIPGYIRYAGASKAASDFTSTDTTTLTNITGLTAAIGASRNYRFKAVLWVSSTGTTDNWKVGIVHSGTVTDIKYTVKYLNGTAEVVSAMQTSSGSAVSCTAGGSTDFIVIEGFITTNAAGNLTVQIAKQATGSDTLKVLRGSNFFVDNVS